MALDHTEMIEDFHWQGISRMRYILPFPVLITALLTSLTALGANDLSFELSLKEHKFTPSELTIPADQRVKLTIKNLDSTPAEFEKATISRPRKSSRPVAKSASILVR